MPDTIASTPGRGTWPSPGPHSSRCQPPRTCGRSRRAEVLVPVRSVNKPTPNGSFTGAAGWAPSPLATLGLDVLDDLRRSTGRMLDTLGHGPQTQPHQPSWTFAPRGAGCAPTPTPTPPGRPVLLVRRPDQTLLHLRPRRPGHCSVVARWPSPRACNPGTSSNGPTPSGSTSNNSSLDDYADRHAPPRPACRDRTAPGPGASPSSDTPAAGTLAAICAALPPPPRRRYRTDWRPHCTIGSDTRGLATQHPGMAYGTDATNGSYDYRRRFPQFPGSLLTLAATTPPPARSAPG